MLHQLLLDDNALVSKLQSEITQAGSKLTENLSSLLKLFSTACQYLPGRIICVFDALDECDPADCPMLIRNIQSMLENGEGYRVIRFLITTRGYPRLLNQFKAYESGLIHLDGDGKQEKDAIQEEITLVLDHKLDNLFKLKGLTQQLERKAALEKALRFKGSQQRTYLWLKLVFDIMERIPWKSNSDWRKIIDSPPQSVNDAYAALLQNVPEEEKDHVKTLLHLMVAAYRPLTLREMSIALIVRDSPGAQDEESLGLQSDGEFKDWIIQTCGFFVTIYDNELYFIHQTAKEFLVGSDPGMPWPQVLGWFSPVTDLASHKIMAESSIAYLSLKCFSSMPFRKRARMHHSAKSDQTGRLWGSLEISFDKDYRFLDYTTEFWAKHFKLCQSFDGTDFSDVGDSFVPHYIALFVTNDCYAPGWVFLQRVRLYKGPVDVAFDLSRRYDVCDAAVWFDHVRLLVHSLHHEACGRESVLHTAAGLNAVSCVRYLAATGSGVNRQDGTGATALCSATSHRATEAANILLDYHADVNLGPTPDALPVTHIAEHYAYTPGYPALLRRMVLLGADLNRSRVRGTRGEMTTTLLAWASRFPWYTNDTLGRDTWIREKLSSSSMESVAKYLEKLDLFATEHFLAEYNLSLVKFLLDHGADIDGNVPNPLSKSHSVPSPVTALEYACFHISEDFTSNVFWNVLFLLHAGANSRLNSETGRSALDWLLLAPLEKRATRWLNAGGRGLSSRVCWHVLAAILLKQNPASGYINGPTSVGAMQTRLHSMISINAHRLVKIKLLLDHGANVNCQDSCGKTPMHYLVSLAEDDRKSDRLDVMEIFISEGADLEARDSLGRTPMHHVRSARVLEMLVRHGADIESRDHQGNTPLHSLLASGASDAQSSVASLIEMRADLTVINSRGETIFHTAARSGLILEFEDSRHDGIDLERADQQGTTPLQAALDHRSYETAALLLKSGASPDPLMTHFEIEQRDKKTGATLLAVVSKYHAHNAVRILLERGADSNSLSDAGIADVATSLDQVIHPGKIKRSRDSSSCLVSMQAQKEKKQYTWIDWEWEGESPLHLAMRDRWTRDAETTVDLLLRHGAEIESRSARDETPLQVAFASGNPKGALFLLERGASLQSTSALASISSDWAENPDLCQALLNQGATWDAGHRDGFRLLHGIEAMPENKPDKSKHRGTGELRASAQCHCAACYRGYENRACAAAHILLDAGAWIEVCNPQGDQESLCRTAWESGWLNLAILLEQADRPSWRRTWLPSNTRRASLPARLHPIGLNEVSTNGVVEDFDSFMSCRPGSKDRSVSITSSLAVSTSSWSSSSVSRPSFSTQISVGDYMQTALNRARS